jgi:hypothetical protein
MHEIACSTQHIPSAARGKLPADGGCVTSCDALVLATVSNWGAYGLLAALEIAINNSIDSSSSSGSAQHQNKYSPPSLRLLPTAAEDSAMVSAAV